MLIDAHLHIFPSIRGYNGEGFMHDLGYGLVKKSTGEVIRLLIPPYVDNNCSPEIMLGFMDMAGIDHAVLMQGNFYGEWNEYCLDAQKKYPDRFTAVGMFNPYATSAEAQYRYCVETLGMKNLKLECSEAWAFGGIYKNINFNDEEFHSFFEYAEKNELTVTFDTGAIGTRAYQPENLNALVSRYQKVKVVIAHLGFPKGQSPTEGPDADEQWEKMISLGANPNVYFDLSNLFGLEGEDYPYPKARGYIKTVYDKFGAEKLLYGSDAPGAMAKCTYQQAIKYIYDYCEFFTSADKEKVFCSNAKKVYHINV